MGGLVLESMIDSYKGSEVFQPVINGIGGNLVSVQSSRMSTMLHQSSIIGILPPHGKIWVTPWAALFAGCTYNSMQKKVLYDLLEKYSSKLLFQNFFNFRRNLSVSILTFYIYVLVLEFSYLIYTYVFLFK